MSVQRAGQQQQPRSIVSAAELARHLNEVRVLDCRSGADAHARYLERHVRGALHVDLERDLASGGEHPEHGGRHPLPSIEQWSATLGRLGIDEQTFVVAYDDKAGANAAARAWWMLRAAGHARVAVLDGALAAAEREGVPLESGEVAVTPLTPYPARSWAMPLLDIDDVELVVDDPAWRLVDVRAAERYTGESEPLDPIAGHIPGAHNVPLTESLTAEGRFKPPEALRAHFAAQLGDVPPERVVVSCGSGVTACHTLLALEHAGLHGASLYVGSWSEWCRSERDRARGPEPR